MQTITTTEYFEYNKEKVEELVRNAPYVEEGETVKVIDGSGWSIKVKKVMTDGKINFIKKDIESLVGTRWKNKKHLWEYLKNKYELEGEKLQKIEKSGLISDYAFVCGIFKEYGYIDIYYLKIPYGEEKIYITEVSVSED
jgi:hypothetical protein